MKDFSRACYDIVRELNKLGTSPEQIELNSEYYSELMDHIEYLERRRHHRFTIYLHGTNSRGTNHYLIRYSGVPIIFSKETPLESVKGHGSISYIVSVKLFPI